MSISFDRLGIWFKLFSGSFYSRRAKHHIGAFIHSIPSQGLVLDIGGGAGTLLDLAHAVRDDLHYLCIDPAMGMLKYVPEYASRVAARSENLPIADGAAKAVTIGDAIHHFTDLDAALDEIYRVLEPQGKLFIFDLDPSTIPGRILVAMERHLGEPANFFSPGELQELLLQNNFIVLSRKDGFRYTLEAEKKKRQ